MSETYTPQVIAHASDPRHVGYIEDADGIGQVGDPNCGDFAVMTIRVRNERIVDCKFLVRGCSAAIAACSMAAELARGKMLHEARQISDETVLHALGGLPPAKAHCSNLAATALQAALSDYYRRQRRDLHNWRALYQRP